MAQDYNTPPTSRKPRNQPKPRSRPTSRDDLPDPFNDDDTRLPDSYVHSDAAPKPTYKPQYINVRSRPDDAASADLDASKDPRSTVNPQDVADASPNRGHDDDASPRSNQNTTDEAPPERPASTSFLFAPRFSKRKSAVPPAPTKEYQTAQRPLDGQWNPLETVQIKDQHFDTIFLRDACRCPQCIDQSTRQRRFETADIPSNIRAKTVDYDEDYVSITWKHDIAGYSPDHTTRIALGWLKRVANTTDFTFTTRKQSWDTAILNQRSNDIHFDFNDYMNDDKVLHKALTMLHQFGLVFVKNLPDETSAVMQTAQRIGPLKNTFYGESWDVRSVSEAKNVAYTDVNLGFHMDLLYMQQPPRLQLLHCLRASTHGGISLFSDAYRAAETLYKTDLQSFEALSSIPVTFHYNNDNHHYYQSRPTFELSKQARQNLAAGRPLASGGDMFEAINWSPPFQRSFEGADGAYALAQDVRNYHKAAQAFRDLIEMEDVMCKRQMAPGECVIFDNRRVLHARTAFSGGERWLRGCYVDDDPFLSKTRTMKRLTHS